MSYIKIKFNAVKAKVEGLNQDLIDNLKDKFKIELTEDKFNDFKSKSKISLSREDDDFYLIETFNKYIEIPTGLLVQLTKYLKLIKLEYNLDKRLSSVELGVSYININSNFILREEQLEIISKCIKAKRGVVKAPTSVGKSIIQAAILNQFNNSTYRLVLVPTVSLLYQMQKDIAEYLNIVKEEIGLIGDGNYNPLAITVAIPDTLANRVQDWNQETIDYLNKVNVVLTDEAHTALTPSMLSVTDELINTEYRLGFSATPPKDNFILLEGIIGPPLIGFSEKYMMAKGIILTPEITFHQVTNQVYLPPKMASFKFEKFEGKEMWIYNNLYNTVICSNAYRNNLAANLVEQRLKEGRTVLILVKKVGTSGGVVSHAEIFKEILLDRNIDLQILHGKSKNRESILEDLEAKRIQGLIASTGILSEGVSIKSISSLILLCGGKEAKDFIQRVGRTLRKQEGKLRPTVDDFIDCQSVFINQSKARLKCAIDIYGRENVQVK